MGKWVLPIAVAVACAAGQARANAFDDCVLENMRGTTSDLAAKSIKVACLRKSSVDISKEDLVGISGRAEYADWGPQYGKGFLLQLENNTAYIVTSVTIDVHVGVGDNQFFQIDDFWSPTPGVIYPAPPPDPTVSMQIPRHSKITYRLVAPQTGTDIKTQNFKWGISAAKGIPSK